MNKKQTRGIIQAVNQLREHPVINLKESLINMALEMALQPNFDPQDEVYRDGIMAIITINNFLRELQSLFPFGDNLATTTINIGVITDIVRSHAELISADIENQNNAQKKQILYDIDQCEAFINHVQSKFN